LIETCIEYKRRLNTRNGKIISNGQDEFFFVFRRNLDRVKWTKLNCTEKNFYSFSTFLDAPGKLTIFLIWIKTVRNVHDIFYMFKHSFEYTKKQKTSVKLKDDFRDHDLEKESDELE